MNYEISVIIPMFNSETTIKNCINSVINQTYKGKTEIIIINDGSSDKSKEIVQEIIDSNTSNVDIKLINKENGGVSSARNIGLNLASGNYIALLDSDDEWLYDKIEKQIEIFKNIDEISFIGGLTNNKKLKKDRLISIPLIKLIFKNYFQPSTVIFKKNIIKKIGYFNEDQKYAEEGNYFFRIANEYKCVLINEQLILYGQGKSGFGVSGLSANLKEMEKGELKNLIYAFKNRYISFFIFLIATLYSLLKYIRRLIIIKFK